MDEDVIQEGLHVVHHHGFFDGMDLESMRLTARNSVPFDVMIVLVDFVLRLLLLGASRMLRLFWSTGKTPRFLPQEYIRFISKCQ